MIPPRKVGWFTRWFAGSAQNRMRRSFGAVHVRGLDALRRELLRRPVLIVSNHTAWWDPLVALVTSERLLHADGFAMMDARNLERLPFFGRVGAFGVSLEDPADGARAIRQAAKLLDRPGRLVWIFPQGREVPVTVRPLAFRPGAGAVAWVARRKAAVVPVGLRYEHGGGPLPELWISIGPALEPTRGDAQRQAELQEQAVAHELQHIEAALLVATGAATADHDAHPFEVVMRARRPWADEVATRLLAWLAR